MKHRISSPHAANNPLNEDEPRSNAAKEARRRGLQHIGYGRYADPSDPSMVVAKTVNGRLVAVTPKKDKPSKKKASKEAPPKKTIKQPKSKSVTTKKSKVVKDIPVPARKEEAPKNKSLRRVNTSRSEAFVQSLPDNQKEFFAKSQKERVLDEPFQFSGDFKKRMTEKAAFPVKYLDLLERLAGVVLTTDTKSIRYFTSADVGAGEVRSQAGELMTMVSTAMNDDEAEEFFDQLYLATTQAEKSTKGALCLNSGWIRAAQETRYINRKRLAERYGEGNVEITHTAWDNADEVEALGLENYKENKGYSTDMYVKIRVNGKEILNEISLKKSLDVNLFNSSPARFFDYDPDLTKELDPKVYQQRQFGRLDSFASEYKKQLLSLAESGASKEFSKVLKAKKLSLDDLNAICEGGATNRAQRKLIKVGMEALAERDSKVKQFYEDHMSASKKYAELAVKEFATNEKMRDGLLEDIRKEFPLKAVADKEEDMSLGGMSLDNMVMTELFGTSDFDQIKEHLTVEMAKGGYPFIGYKAETGGKIIPLARIDIREDGLGYGGSKIRFDLALDSGFRDPLRNANEAIYGKVPDFSKKARKNAGKQDVMMDQVNEIIREELRVYLKRKQLDMSESEYRKFARSLIEAEEGPFGKSGSGLAKPKDKKNDKKDDETPFDQMQQAMGGAGGGGMAPGGAGQGQQQQVGDKPNEKEKEMSKDLAKLASTPEPKAKSALGKAVIQYANRQDEKKYPNQDTMNILDTNQSRIVSFAKKAFQAYPYAKAIRAIENRLRSVYDVKDEDVMTVASAVAHIMKKDKEPTIDPLRRSPGHRRQFNPWRGY